MKRYNKAVLAARAGEFEEFMNTINSMDFEEACAYCYDNWNDIHTIEDIIEFAAIDVKHNRYPQAIAVLKALNDGPVAQYYVYDELHETKPPKAIRNEFDLEQYVASKFK